jgi:hypothetical protein
MAGNNPVGVLRAFLLGPVLFSVFHLSSPALRADDGANLIHNPGFEDPPGASAAYSLFIPPDSTSANCRFTIVASDTFHAGKQAALMQTDDFARFALGPQATYPVVAGDLYRIGVWVKAGADFQVQPDSPGVALRLNFTATAPAPAATNFTFVYLNKTVSQAGPPDFGPLSVNPPDLSQWTHLEAVVKVPAGVDSLRPELFFWKAKGSLYVDDFNLQKVDPATPLSAFASSDRISSAHLLATSAPASH